MHCDWAALSSERHIARTYVGMLGRALVRRAIPMGTRIQARTLIALGGKSGGHVTAVKSNYPPTGLSPSLRSTSSKASAHQCLKADGMLVCTNVHSNRDIEQEVAQMSVCSVSSGEARIADVTRHVASLSRSNAVSVVFNGRAISDKTEQTAGNHGKYRSGKECGNGP